jgi:hypothetical protein
MTAKGGAAEAQKISDAEVIPRPARGQAGAARKEWQADKAARQTSTGRLSPKSQPWARQS